MSGLSLAQVLNHTFDDSQKGFCMDAAMLLMILIMPSGEERPMVKWEFESLKRCEKTAAELQARTIHSVKGTSPRYRCHEHFGTSD